MRHVRDRWEPARGSPEANLTPADVQKAIRIRDRYLQALEEERWELLPGDAYVKGFLRTYADYLGLDGNLYVEEYNSRFAQPDEPQLVPERFARTRHALRRRRVPAAADRVAVIVAIVAGLAAWQLSGSRTTSRERRRPRPSPTTTASHPHEPKKTNKKHHVSAALPTPRRSRGVPRRLVALDSLGQHERARLIYQGTLLQGKTRAREPPKGQVWIRMGDPTASTSDSAASSCMGCRPRSATSS